MDRCFVSGSGWIPEPDRMDVVIWPLRFGEETFEGERLIGPMDGYITKGCFVG